MTTWTTLWILDNSTGRKLWNSTVSAAAVPGAIRELERHYAGIKAQNKAYAGFSTDVTMFVQGQVHYAACALPELSDDDLMAELMG